MVTCPFLRTSLKAGILVTKPEYTKEELLDFSTQAGLARSVAEKHIDGNFRNIPTGRMNIFDMEGNPNEHVTSTGIMDCPSKFPSEVGSDASDCKTDDVIGNLKCAPVGGCVNGAFEREKKAFEFLQAQADTNHDGILTPAEFTAVQPKYSTTADNTFGRLSDINDGQSLDFNVGGTIAGSFDLLTRVYGETCTSITVATLKLVTIDRQLPSHYKFPSSRICGADDEEQA